MPRRIERLNEQLKRELAVLLRTGVRDPRIGSVTVTAVRTTPDLNLARVLVRLTGSDDEKREVLEGLDRAAPFLRRTLGSELRIRRVPELAFQEDVSQQRADRIEELLSKVRPEGGWDEPEDDAEGDLDRPEGGFDADEDFDDDEDFYDADEDLDDGDEALDDEARDEDPSGRGADG